MITIMLCEDDKELNMLTSTYLKKSGFNVISVFNGLDGITKFYEEKIDLVLSDIMMPLCDGIELAKTIRSQNEQIPIIFISARDDKPTKNLGYKVGVDDYITKPFDLDELVLKINAICRRLNINRPSEVVLGNLKMNAEEHYAMVDDEVLNLSVREFNILYYMIQNPKKIFTRSKLMEDFWDFDSSTTSRTVDVYMAKIRDKTKNCDGFEIETVHGLGYKVVLK